MSKDVGRTILTILTYAGVFIFFIPHLTGKASSTFVFNAFGAVMAVVCGLARCYYMEGDCDEARILQNHRPRP